MLLKSIYTFFLALLLALFIAMGIAVFYPEPKSPLYPETLSRPVPATGEEERVNKAEERRRVRLDQAFQLKQRKYERSLSSYNRDVSLASLVASILILAASLTFLKSIPTISDGLLLGGVFTLGYSIIRGFAGNDDMFRFFVVSVGLAVTLLLGYKKFIQTEESK